MKTILTLRETAEYLGLKKSYLYRLTSARLIPHSKPNGKMIYFSVDDLNAWMMSNRIHTEGELNDLAQTYCITDKNKNHYVKQN